MVWFINSKVFQFTQSRVLCAEFCITYNYLLFCLTFYSYNRSSRCRLQLEEIQVENTPATKMIRQITICQRNAKALTVLRSPRQQNGLWHKTSPTQKLASPK